ncbi:MAG: family transporter [Moraxellaceae bacterium]|jgi:predicted PurR-regulated permease PerM|nr:family transporter [Moraxellaceae bacterium]
MDHTELHQKSFLLLLILATLGFGWILLPFFNAVFWAAVLAIVFTPLHHRLQRRLPRRHNLAALATLLLCLVMVILPLLLLGNLLAREVAETYEKFQSGRMNLGTYLRDGIDLLPEWLGRLLERHGFANINTVQDKISSSAMQGGQFLFSRTLVVGQNTMNFLIGFALMLYLLFFLLRDGVALTARIRQALPLSMAHKQRLLTKFTTVIRATIKGNFVVAAVQGTLGGVIFALLGIEGAVLWGAVMAFLSLLPAFGAALVWAPVALYFLFSGELWRGVVLIVFGMGVIGLIDNLLRPILVGRDTRMPDYVVLVSTLGGLALFGLSGFVIGPVIAGLFISAWDIFEPGAEAPP